MQSTSKQRQLSDEFVAGSGDLREVQEILITQDRECDVANEDAASQVELPESRFKETRPNPLWAVNGALAAFVFAAVMYLASR